MFLAPRTVYYSGNLMELNDKYESISHDDTVV